MEGVRSAIKFSGVKTLPLSQTQERCGRGKGDAGGWLGTVIPLFIHSLGEHLLSKYYVSDIGSGDGCNPALGLQELTIQQEKNISHR